MPARFLSGPTTQRALTLDRTHQFDDYITALRIAPGGKHLAVATAGGRVAIIDLQQGDVRADVDGHRQAVQALSWAHDGSVLASAGQDGQVCFWESSGGAARSRHRLGDMWIEAIAWSPKPDRLLAAAIGRELVLLDSAGAELTRWTGFASTITDVDWGGAGRLLAAGYYRGVSLLAPDREAPIRVLPLPGAAQCVAWHPDGRHLAVGNRERSAYLWPLLGAHPMEMRGFARAVDLLDWDRRGKILATASDSAIVLWDCTHLDPSERPPHKLTGHADRITAMRFQRRGQLIASGDRAGTIVCWKSGRIPPVVSVYHAGAGISALDWSWDDRLLVAGCADGTVLLLTAPRG